VSRTATLDALVVDDEPFARSGLRLLLEDDEDITSVREAASGRAAIDAMAARRPDLVLLDVQMPGMTGFDVVDTVGAGAMPGVVFVTAHDRYAVRAFEINAIDYLLKPVTASRFSEAMARAKARLQTQEAQSAQLSSLLRTVAAPNQYVTRLAARDGGRTTLIDVDSVEWMKAAENYVELHVGRATHLVHVPLTTLCGWLDPNQFIRVHRSIVVATRMIRDLEPSGHGEYEIRQADAEPAGTLGPVRDRHTRERPGAIAR
jgi:two-component system, LytTR family, response regulator